MASGQRFYWLKLKRDFFKRHDVKIIEAQENGAKYVLFYLKLLCESIDHNGNLRFNDTIPYDIKMLATITDTDVDLARSAVVAFTAMGIMDCQDNGTYYMSQIENMTGTETDWANRKREQRAISMDNVHPASIQRPPGVHEENRVRVRDRDRDRDREDAPPNKPPRHRNGEFGHVLLTDEEKQKLSSEWGQATLGDYVRRLDEYIETRGAKYKNHALTMRRWKAKDEQAKKRSGPERHERCTTCGRPRLHEDMTKMRPDEPCEFCGRPQ